MIFMKFTKNTLKRALRTFIQAAVAYIAVNIVAVDLNGEKETVRTALIGLAISAVAAGLSAAMNLEKSGSIEYEEVIDE
jgi:ABC-type Fe3+-siderophore transport system permease subunit